MFHVDVTVVLRCVVYCDQAKGLERLLQVDTLHASRRRMVSATWTR
jgi:hypothetical protein